MNRLFRFDQTFKRDPAIDDWLIDQPAELGYLAQFWFDFIRGLGENVRELMHDGHPTACVGDVAFAYVNAFKAHVNVGFFHGADLDDPHGLLEGSGKYMRHVKLRPGRELNEEGLRALIQVAYEDVRFRLRTEK